MQKRKKNPLVIVNPKTNEQVIIDKLDQNSSGSNTHSSALKIEAPSPANTPIQSESQSSQQPNSRTMPLAKSTSDGSATLIATPNEIEQPTCMYTKEPLISSRNKKCFSNEKQIFNFICVGDPNYSNVEHQLDNEEPPTTPVVSAIADGPSVDITPKQSKSYKRT